MRHLSIINVLPTVDGGQGEAGSCTDTVAKQCIAVVT